MTDAAFVWLIVWGTVVGVDFIAGPQVMMSRPLVAAIVAGVIVGDVTTGAAIGLVLELFAWDVMPFGAARYPDYGVGAVVATGTAAYAPGVLGIGVAIGVGLVTAQIGEWSVQGVRKLNTADLERNIEELDSGDYIIARKLHVRGFIREIFRGAALIGIGLLLGRVIREYVPFGVQSAVAATMIAAGLAIGTGFASGLRASGASRPKQMWYVAGLGLGVVWVLLL